MEPDVNTNTWTAQWPPAPNSTGDDVSTALPPSTPTPRRTRRSRSRRPRSESTRLMLEMLRALAQSEADALAGLSAPGDSSMQTSALDLPPARAEAPPPAAAAERAAEPADGSGLSLLRAQFLGRQPEQIELHCAYCSRLFHLNEGGASFEGKAACVNCEQHLNRDVVLPAVAKHRPHLYEVCDVAEGPDQPKRPGWHRQRRAASSPDQSDGPDPRAADVAMAPEELQPA